MTFDKLNRRFHWLFHLVLWLGVWLFYIYFFSYNSENYYYILVFASILLPVTMAATYVNTLYLIPKFLLVRKYWKFTLYSLYTLVFTSYFILLCILASLMLLTNFVLIDMPPMSRNFSFILILVYLVVAILSFIRVLQSNAEFKETNQALENQLLSNQLEFKIQELDYLKRQIHPHFLFNTLNTIYGHALNSSEKTPELIIKLSNLLDYILYQVNKPLVSISQEIEHIEEYISLEKIRQSEELKLEFTKDIEQDIEIPPMLLLPFIENCFKHGRAIDGLFSINIHIQATESILDLKISNSCNEQELGSQSPGIGLDNIKRRMELLFPNKYRLDCSYNVNEYNVHLHINLR